MNWCHPCFSATCCSCWNCHAAMELARETKAVHKLAVVGGAERGRVVIAHGEEDLGHDDDAFARNVVLLERLADDLLRLAVAVDICRVPGVDAALVGVVD